MKKIYIGSLLSGSENKFKTFIATDDQNVEAHLGLALIYHDKKVSQS